MSSPVVEDRLNALERELAEVKVELARVGMTVPVTSSLAPAVSAKLLLWTGEVFLQQEKNHKYERRQHCHCSQGH